MMGVGVMAVVVVAVVAVVVAVARDGGSGEVSCLDGQRSAFHQWQGWQCRLRPVVV